MSLSSFLPPPSHAPGNEAITTIFPWSSSDGSGDENCSTSSSTSLLERLRLPTPSNLARKRITKRNCPRGVKYVRPPRSTHNPKSVTPANRVRKYSKEPFVVSCGRLFCQVCREEVGLKKSAIDNHVQHSTKHFVGKERLAEKGKREEDIADALCAYHSREHLAQKPILLRGIALALLSNPTVKPGGGASGKWRIS